MIPSLFSIVPRDVDQLTIPDRFVNLLSQVAFYVLLFLLLLYSMRHFWDFSMNYYLSTLFGALEPKTYRKPLLWLPLCGYEYITWSLKKNGREFMKIYKVQEIEWQEQSYSSLLLIRMLQFLINHLILPPQIFMKYFFLIINVHKNKFVIPET